MEALDLIKRCRTRLQKNHPFFACLSLQLTPVEKRDDKRIQTMAVDLDGHLYYNPDFVEKLEEQELNGVMIHEILHLVLLHLIRGKDKNQVICNIADDIVANQLLKDNNFILPHNCLWTNDKNEINVFGKLIKDVPKKSSEDVYYEIFEEAKKQLKQAIKDGKIKKGNGQDGDGIPIELDDYEIDGDTNDGSGKAKNVDNHIRDGKDKKGGGKLSDEELKAKEKEWVDKIQDAYLGSKMIGKVPAGIERLIGKLHESKIGWKTLLLRQVESYIPTNYDYSKCSKKSISAGYYIPATEKTRIEICVAIDVSGSIGAEELNEFISEIVGMARAFRNQIKFTLLTHETEVNNKYVVENGNVEKIKAIKINGGGGTSHKSLMNYIAKEVKGCKLAVFFTDGYSDIQEIDFKKNKFRSIFVINKKGTEEQLFKKPVKVIKLR